MKLSARLVSLMAALSGETDPTKRAGISAVIASKSARMAEKSKDGDDDPDDDGDDDEDSKAKRAAEEAVKAKKAAEAAKHRAKAAEHKQKMEEAEEEAKRCEADGEESEEAKKAAAQLAAASPSTDHGALLASLAASVRKIEQTQIAASKATLIAEARKLNAITKTEAADLGGQPLAYVETFLAMRAKAGFVVTNEGDLVKAKDAKPGTEASLPAETLAMIEHSLGGAVGEQRAALRKELIAANLKAHTDALAQANGAGGRY
jgi:hypothetical protein